MADQAAKIFTPVVRGQFVRVINPKKGQNGKKDSYEFTGITELLSEISPKNKELLVGLQKAAKDALRAEFGDKAFTSDGKIAEGYEWPFKDAGKKAEYEGFEAGRVCFDMKSVQKPGVADATRGKASNGEFPPADAEDIYSGAYYIAEVEPYAYRPKEGQPKKGVMLTLRNVVKVGKGQRLDGQKSAGATFAELSEADFAFSGAVHDDGDAGSDKGGSTQTSAPDQIEL